MLATQPSAPRPLVGPAGKVCDRGLSGQVLRPAGNGNLLLVPETESVHDFTVGINLLSVAGATQSEETQ